MNKRVLWLLFAANIISGVAQGVSMMAIPYYFACQSKTSDFNFAYAIVTFFTLIWGFFAGTLVDQFNRKSVFITSNLAQATILLGVSAWGTLQGEIPFGLIISVFAATFLSYQIHYPNLYAFVQEITPVQEYPKITAKLEITGQVTSILSGALTAVLLSGSGKAAAGSWVGRLLPVDVSIDPWPLTRIFAFDGLTYVVAAILISQIRYVTHCSVRPEKRTLASRMTTCLAFIRRHPLLIIFGSLANVVFVSVTIELHTLMPSYLLHHLKAGPALVGGAQATFAAGALIAGLFVRKLFSGRSTQQVIIILMAVTGCCFAIVALSKSAFIFCLFCFFIGFANAGIRIYRLTFLLKNVPNYLMGRINSVFILTNTAMRSFFSLLFSQAYFTSGANVTMPFTIVALYIIVSALLIIAIYHYAFQPVQVPAYAVERAE